MRCLRFFEKPSSETLQKPINSAPSQDAVMEVIPEQPSELAPISNASSESELEDTNTYSMRDWLLYLLTVGGETALTAGFLLKIMFAFDICDEDDEQGHGQDTLFYSILALMPVLGMIHTFFAKRVLLSKRDIPDLPDLSVSTLFDFTKNFAPVYLPVLGFAWASMHELLEYFILREDSDTPLEGNHSLFWGSFGLALFTSIPRAVFLYGELQNPEEETNHQEQALACLPRIQEWIRHLPRPRNIKEGVITFAALLSAATEGALAIEGLFVPLKTFGIGIGKTVELACAIPAMSINALLELNATLANLKYLELSSTEKNYKSLLRLWLSASVIAIGPAAGMIEFALTLDEDTSKPVLAALSLTTLFAAFQNEKTILSKMLIEDNEGNTSHAGSALLEEGRESIEEGNRYGTFISLP